LVWIWFILCTSAIVYSGSKLSRYGDIIAEKSGMGRTWIGMVLMATVTSLPELVTGISSVTYSNLPDIATGDVIGSCVFNMLILAFLDVFYPREPISSKAHHGHVLSGSMGILLLSIVAVNLFASDYTLSIGWIGLYSFLFLLIYFTAVRLIFVYEKRHISKYIKEVAIELKYEKVSTRKAIINYAINALIVIIAAVFLPRIGERIADITGLGQTFVGNILIAISTSLPEVVVSLSAVRMNALDLAIGNLFGSNIFNIMILGIDDIFYIEGPLLSFVSQNHIIPAISAVIMMSIAIIGLTYRAEKKRLFMAWDSICILSVYVINMILLFLLRGTY
jgi:cation:H+ antiporter